MTARAPGTNSKLRRRETKAIERRDTLVAKYIAEGLTEEEAKARAMSDLRDNDKADYRRG